jgi:hypothetical protein
MISASCPDFPTRAALDARDQAGTRRNHLADALHDSTAIINDALAQLN